MPSESQPPRKRRLIDYLLGYEKFRLSEHMADAFRKAAPGNEIGFCGIGTRFSEFMRHSRLLRVWNGILRRLSGAPTAIYGTLAFTFGVSTLLFHLADYYIRAEVEVPVMTLMIGALFALLSIPAFFMQHPLSLAAQRNDLTDTIFFEVFCFRRLRASEVASDRRLLPPILMGIALGALGWLFPIRYVLIGLFGLLFLVLSLSSPEFAYYIALPALPIFPLLGSIGKMLLLIILGIALLSFALKVMLGKRVFHLSVYDVVLMIFALFVLLSGLPVFGGNQMSAAWQTVAVCFAYLPTANFILNRRVADSSVYLVIFSSTAASAYGIVRFVFEVLSGTSALVLHPEWQNAFFFPGLAEKIGYHRLTATFSSPELFAALLGVSIVNTVIYLDEARREHSRDSSVLLTASLILCSAALLLTFTPGVLLSLLLTVLAYRVLRSSRIPNFVLLPLSMMALIPLFVPDGLREALLVHIPFRFSDAPIASLRATLLAKARLFTDAPLFGSGTFFTESGSNGTFLASILASAGIFVTVLLFSLFLLRLGHIDRYTGFLRTSSVRLPVLSTACALFFLLTVGASVNIFTDTAISFLFWSIFGVGTATLRIAKAENDELRYLSDAAESDVASAEIPLRA